MWSFSLTILQTGGFYLVFFQPASSTATCQSAERFCMSLFLATILLCLALCCLQRWLTRCRRFSSQPTVAVFALSDVDSGYGNDVAPGMPPKVHPHPWSPERYSSCCSRSNTTGTGLPPPYEEVVKPASPSRAVIPGEQHSKRGPAEESQLSQSRA